LSLNYEKFLESFQTSNNFQFEINSNILVLKAHQEVLSIAGILVNKKFEYDNNTKSLLIEASIFNSKQIRQISRSIGVRTERSSVYEKGLNSTYLIESLCRLLYLLKSLNNKISINIHTAATLNEIKPTIIYPTKKLADQVNQFENLTIDAETHTYKSYKSAGLPPLEKDIILYRGINDPTYINQNSYISTSLTLNGALNFKYNNCCILKIYIPSGTKIIPLYSIFKDCDFGQLDEKEVYWGLYFNVLGYKGLVCRLGNGKGIISEVTKQKIDDVIDDTKLD
jgi:hypothetical protein